MRGIAPAKTVGFACDRCELAWARDQGAACWGCGKKGKERTTLLTSYLSPGDPGGWDLEV